MCRVKPLPVVGGYKQHIGSGQTSLARCARIVGVETDHPGQPSIRAPNQGHLAISLDRETLTPWNQEGNLVGVWTVGSYADGESKLAHVECPNGRKWTQILANEPKRGRTPYDSVGELP